MFTFKQFLAQQDDSIDEEDAIASYNEYKADFKRKQVEEFFEKHKDEDWLVTVTWSAVYCCCVLTCSVNFAVYCLSK